MGKRDKLCSPSVMSPGETQNWTWDRPLRMAMEGTADPWLNAELEKNKVPWLLRLLLSHLSLKLPKLKLDNGSSRVSIIPVKPPTFKKG